MGPVSLGSLSVGDDLEPVVMLHGFSQNGRCLGPLADRLSEAHTVLTPDLAGHGSAGRFAFMNCAEAGDHLLDTLGWTDPPGAGGHGPAHWIGYSLGGRIALHVALRHPEWVRSLVLIGTTGGIWDDSERHERRALDHLRADDLEREGVWEFTRRWLEMDMFAGLPEDARFQAERCSNTAEGLAGSLRNAGTGSMEPLWNRLGALEMPVLILSGSLDAKFTEQGTQLVDAIGDNATGATVAAAGHAAHLEAPGPTYELVADFLACSGASGGRVR